MKIIKTSHEYRNTVLFLILSLVFVSAINAIAEGQFLFLIGFMIKNLISNWPIFLLGIISVFFVLKFKKYSEWIMLIYVSAVTLKSFYYLTMSFNKLILGLDFLYLIFAFYFFTSWEIFSNSAIHMPNFSENDLEKETRFKIVGNIYRDNSFIATCLLTNIDEEGCFVLIQKSDCVLTLQETLRLSISFDGVLFQSTVKLVSKYDQGVGLVFCDEELGNLRSLHGLYQICLQRGIV